MVCISLVKPVSLSSLDIIFKSKCLCHSDGSSFMAIDIDEPIFRDWILKVMTLYH